MGLPVPKPEEMYALGDANETYEDGYWADSKLRITSGAGAGLEFDVTDSYTSPDDTIVGNIFYPDGLDWVPDGITIFRIDDEVGFPEDLGIMPGDTYMITKRWMQFEALADYSDGTQVDVTTMARWHLSEPTYGTLSAGYFNSTYAMPGNLVIYAEYSGLISNYVPIAIR
jgi:hypothetical protein